MRRAPLSWDRVLAYRGAKHYPPREWGRIEAQMGALVQRFAREYRAPREDVEWITAFIAKDNGWRRRP